MQDDLLKKSAQWGQKSLRSYLDNEYEYFFVQAGVSFELLGKAYLAGLHPSLIIDKDFDSLLQVCGVHAHIKRPLGNIKTIGARDVIARAIKLLPQLKSYENHLTMLADLRNGVVHIGSAVPATASGIVGPFLRATQVLLESCDVKLEHHFAGYSEIARKLIDESLQELERVVATKIARARVIYDEKYGELEAKTVQQIASVIYKSYTFYKYETMEEDCPACSEIGIASGSYEIGGEYGDWDDIVPEPKVTLHVNHYTCNMCGLELNGTEEIRAAHLHEKIEISDIDLADFYDVDDRPD